MNKREAKMQIVFKHYLQNRWKNGSAVFELKRSTDETIPTRAVAAHQSESLEAAYESSIYYKLPDDTAGYKPFDCSIWQQALAYIVIGFGKRLTQFHLIPIWTWQARTKNKNVVSKQEIEKWPDVEIIKIPNK